MRAIDLYKLTRIEDPEVFCSFEKALSARAAKAKVKPHEITCLSVLVRHLIENGVSAEGLQNFYFSYIIPQIGKEFDLLRVNEKSVINIELKSRDVGAERIGKQLAQNSQYLSHLSRDAFLFTFISGPKKFYQFTADETIIECGVSALINLLHKQSNCFDADVDSLFRVSDFLVSPLNTPEKFARKEYFLTPQQQENKNEIMEKVTGNIGSTAFFGITGSPGTGKTLALFDLALACSSRGKSCIIHCGILTDGHHWLNKHIPNLDIYAAKEFYNIDFQEYRYVFVDESHRFYEKQFDALIKAILSHQSVCFFSYDARQILSYKETHRDIVGRIRALPTFEEYKLSNKIRTNKEMASFIRRLLNLHHPDKQSRYPSISVVYANDETEATHFIQEYRAKGYVFINYTQSQYNVGPFDKYSADTDTHHVIGQEFDDILMLLDNTFRYDSNGKLEARTHPNPDYLYKQLLFQGLTRVRERLTIIILNNPTVFSQILSIMGDSDK